MSLRVQRGAKRKLDVKSVPTAPADEEFDLPTEGIVEESPQLAAMRKAQQRDQKMARVASIANEVNAYIASAVSAREGSGVEARWRDDLTYYYGDSKVAMAVRGITDQAQASKALTGKDEERGTRSTISVNITRPKVNAAFARLSDMMLPVDDRNFAIEPTPVAQLAADADPNALKAAPGGKVVTANELALKKTEVAKAACKLMQQEIDDNLTECDFNAEARKMLFEAVCLGTGVIRGPVASSRIEKAWIDDGQGNWTMRAVENLVPESRHIPIWNFYPDPACNGNVKNARFIVERDEYNARMLRDLRDQPGYIKESVDLCLSQKPGPIRRQKSEVELVQGSYRPGDSEMYEVYHVTCDMTKGQLDDLGVQGVGGWKMVEVDGQTVKRPVPLKDECREDPVGACVVICNGYPIKAYLNPLKSGDHGYQVYCYEPVHGQVFGIGISFLVRSPQRVLSTAWRMVMDNAAMTVGGLVVVDKTCIEPADDVWDLYGGKVFYKVKGLNDGGKVEEAFKVFNMDSHLDQLEKIIMLAIKFAEDETSLPSLMEGNQGSAPDTVGGMTLLMNSANVVLKVLAKRYDDCITKPHIAGYYEWHMLYSKKSEIKGDFNVMARGSSHLVVRDLERQSLLGFMQYLQNPTLAIFFKNGGYDGLRKVAEANHITPDDVLCSEEQAPDLFKQFQQAQAQAAQAAAGGKAGPQADPVALKKMDQEDRERDRDFQREMKQMEMNIQMMKLATEKDMTLEQVKAALAGQVMKQQHESSMQNKEVAVKERLGSGI